MSRRSRRSQALSRTVAAHRRKRQSRPLQVETLETRQLLAVTPGFLGIPGLQADPADHASSHILVRFQEGAQPVAGFRAEAILPEANLWKVTLGHGVSVQDAVRAFGDMPDVVHAQPDYRVHMQVQAWYETSTPNDAFYWDDYLWGLHNTQRRGGVADADIDAPEAWKSTRGAGMIVAVIDSGVDYQHLDLRDQMWVNTKETPGNLIDDDNNGYVDDYLGYDFANNDPDPMDDVGHGTHVAGTIAATANNDTGVDSSSNSEQGMIGAAPDARIMALKFLDSSGSGTTSNAIRALKYAVQMGARISNNSYGGSPYEQIMFDAISWATSQEHLFIAAAGNGNWLGVGQNNDSTPFYPANYQPEIDSVISVAATNNSDQYGGFSNYGATTVDLAAPGVAIWSTYPKAKDTVDGTAEGYTRKDGTSMAAPHVAGSAALVWASKPALTALQVKQILMTTIDPISGKATVTNGRVNAAQAVAKVPVVDAPPVVSFTNPKADGILANSVVLTASAMDDVGVSQVEFLVDGVRVGVDNNGLDGWSVSWDTTTASEGEHKLTATATDTKGQLRSASLNARVNNHPSDLPTVTITSPTSSSTVFGTVTLRADATDNSSEISKVEFYANGKSIGLGSKTTEGWSLSWNTTTVADGSHDLTAVATDREGDSSSSPTVNVTVSNVVYVTNTYTNSTSVALKDGGKTTSVISLPAVDVSDINVELIDLRHPNDADLRIYLRSPGTSTTPSVAVLLVNRVGGTGDNFTKTVLDDSATLSIKSGSAPFTGSFRPEQALSGFVGKRPAGNWTLEVWDDARKNTGTLVSWSLVVTSKQLRTSAAALSATETRFNSQSSFNEVELNDPPEGEQHEFDAPAMLPGLFVKAKRTNDPAVGMDRTWKPLSPASLDELFAEIGWQDEMSSAAEKRHKRLVRLQ